MRQATIHATDTTPHHTTDRYRPAGPRQRRSRSSHQHIGTGFLRSFIFITLGGVIIATISAALGAAVS
jgi:hypothetical protein